MATDLIRKLTLDELSAGGWSAPALDPSRLGPYTDDHPITEARLAAAHLALGGEYALGPDLRIEGNWWLFWRP